MMGATPVPVSVMLKGLLVVALLAICSAAVFRPVLAGVKQTVKVVLLPGFTGATGLVVTLKLAASGPSMMMPKPVRSAVPLFVMMKVRLVLVPTSTEPKLLLPTPLTRFVPRGC